MANTYVSFYIHHGLPCDPRHKSWSGLCFLAAYIWVGIIGCYLQVLTLVQSYLLSEVFRKFGGHLCEVTLWVLRGPPRIHQDVCADLDNFRAQNWWMYVSQSRQLCTPHGASRQFWWRSRKEIWMRLVAYGYHSKMYWRPGGRMGYMMVFWSTNCIWGDILKILLCLWWNPDNFTYMAEVRTVLCCGKIFAAARCCSDCDRPQPCRWNCLDSTTDITKFSK